MSEESTALRQRIYELIEQRYPRGERTAEQTLRLGTIKLIEETLEAAMSIALPRQMSSAIEMLSVKARKAFREREWLADEWTSTPSASALAGLKAELVDTYITVAHLSRVLVEVSGQEFDLETEALWKAQADRARA